MDIANVELKCINKNFLNGVIDPSKSWSDRLYHQLKIQIIAYKCLIRNQPVPEEIVREISLFDKGNWMESKKSQDIKMVENFKQKFKDYDITMKELAPFFKKRIKEQDLSNSSSGVNTTEKNFFEEVEYTYENEIENKKSKLKMLMELYDSNTPYLNQGYSTNDDKFVLFLDNDQQLFYGFKSFIAYEDRQRLESEYKFLNIHNLQTKVRKEVLGNFVGDLDKQNVIYYNDMLFSKTLLDRRSYKRAPQEKNKKDVKINERFEQQLRNGYDIRKKNKHRDFINEVIQVQKDFTEYFRTRKIQIKKRAALAKAYTENKEKKGMQAKDRLDRDRLRFLRDNKIDEYVDLLKQAKNTRLLDFMGQTSAFLKEIENKVIIQKEVNKTVKVSQTKSVVTEQNAYESESKMEVEKAADPEEPKEKKQEEVPNYYTTAHSIKEEIVKQPTLLTGGTLKSYQIIGLQWMVSLYNNNLNGILADEMGLGKTIQTIALLTYIVEKKKNNGPYLIVAPLSTISNWTSEFAKWSPFLKVIIYKGSPAERKSIAIQMKSDKEKFNVIITTYEYIMKDKYMLNKVFWQYIIVDEGHRMKNFKSKFTQTLGTQFSSVCRVLLTGTPLQNNLGELWALLNFLLPKIFNSCDDFEKWFNQPFSNKVGGNSSDRQNFELNEEEQLLIINRLHQVLRPFLLRREKVEVEKELPSKTEHVVKIELSAWQKIMYGQIKFNGLLARDPSTGKIGNKALVNAMMQLRKICNHPFLFIERDSPIYQNVNDNIFRSSGKFELLDRIIPKLLRFNHKILLFSQMTQLMDILQLFFDYKGYPHLRLDGNTKSDDRGMQMKIFNDPESPYKIFILSTRAGGLGLNLQAADTVIIFDSDWNPQMDIQAQDRAHRIGQRNEVRVLRLVTQTEIEEDILSKAAFKKNLDEKIIRAGMYNSTITDGERKKKLEDLLKQDKDEDNEAVDDITTDEQINIMIARSSEEFTVFQDMDTERYVRENRDERVKEILRNRKPDTDEKEEPGKSNKFSYSFIKKKKPLPVPVEQQPQFDEEYYANEEDADQDYNQEEYVNYRLMTEDEVPEWIKIKESSKDTVKTEYGKGMRVRPKVDYKDDINKNMIDQLYDAEEDSMLEKKRLKKHKKGNLKEDGNDSDEFEISNSIDDTAIKAHELQNKRKLIKIRKDDDSLSLKDENS